MRPCAPVPHLTPAERRLRREAQSAALRQRAFALRQTGATYAGIGRELGLSLERARQLVHKAERRILQPHWYDDLPQRAIGMLYARGLLDCPEHEVALALAQVSVRELMRTSNFGRTSLAALCAWLTGHGLKLRSESAHAFATRLRREASPDNDEGAPSQRRPCSNDSDPLTAGRKDETPCPYTIKAT